MINIISINKFANINRTWNLKPSFQERGTKNSLGSKFRIFCLWISLRWEAKFGIWGPNCSNFHWWKALCKWYYLKTETLGLITFFGSLTLIGPGDFRLKIFKGIMHIWCMMIMYIFAAKKTSWHKRAKPGPNRVKVKPSWNPNHSQIVSPVSSN